MKTNRIHHWWVAGGVAALLAAMCTTAIQANPHGPRGGRGPGNGINQSLNLTAAQQQALLTAHSNIVAQSQTLLKQLGDARTALHDAVLADTPKEDAIRAAAKTIGDIEGSLAVIRATELAKIHPLFSADQWTQLKALGFFHRGLLQGMADEDVPPMPGTN